MILYDIVTQYRTSGNPCMTLCYNQGEMADEPRKEKTVKRSTTPVSVTLDDDRLAWLDRKAEELKLNRSEYLRRLIDKLRESEP